MKWVDIIEIVFSLLDNYPDKDPTYILFTDLHKMIVDLDDFATFSIFLIFFLFFFFILNF